LKQASHHYGDHISIRGNLQTPPDYGDFSYQDYLARQGIYSLMSYAYVELYEENAGNPILSAIYRLKDHSREVLQQNFPSPESDLLSGILLGDESGLSPQLKSAYQLTGTAHIIAISGFNIAILAGLITSLLNRALGTKWGTLAAILTIGVYTILVGADAAVVRAAIMGIAGAMGTLIGRRQNGLNTLGLAAFVMCIFNPNMPWDISFQLSFFATLGLVIYAPPLQARFLDFLSRYVPEDTAQRLAGPISEYLIFTLVAQALVLPLLAYHFGNFSPLFLLANPLILPPQPLVMILGGIALLGGLLNPALGKALAYLAWPFAAYTNRMVTWLATLPAGKLSISTFSFLWVVLYYLLFFTLTFAKDRKALFKQFLKPATLLLALGCIALIVWSTAFSAPDGRLTLTLLPDTNSPVLLVETPAACAPAPSTRHLVNPCPSVTARLTCWSFPHAGGMISSGLADYQTALKSNKPYGYATLKPFRQRDNCISYLTKMMLNKACLRKMPGWILGMVLNSPCLQLTRTPAI